ncbi:hypothetical protein, partial [Prevotella sp.]|uniref:hypothetical protein n=1 Tax=Prevotella sp. TaxID=59823 RepID=UPI0025E035C9
MNISQRYELILTNIHWQLENCVCLYLIFTYANIVQTIKMCYKIKIDSRASKSCFYGVLLCKQHPSLTRDSRPQQVMSEEEKLRDENARLRKAL